MPKKAKKQGSSVPAPKGGKKKGKGGGGNGVGQAVISVSSVGAAFSASPSRVGMSDVTRHTISWLTGYVYVGNGTLGATDSVYFSTPGGKLVVANATKGLGVPLLPMDADVGASYAQDVMKHYGRYRVVDAWLDVSSVAPATSNSMVAIVAPARGNSLGVGQTVTDTTAAHTGVNVLGMAAAVQVPSWGSCRISLRSFIAGGSGPQQNEFNVNSGDGSTGIAGQDGYAGTMVVPASFVVTGSNQSAGLRGTNQHYVIATMVVDLLDFVGGMSATDPALRRRSLLPSRTDARDECSGTPTGAPTAKASEDVSERRAAFERETARLRALFADVA